MDSEFKRVMSPSLALLTLAALTPEKHHVVIDDENINPINLDDSPDLVGITVNVDTSTRAYEIANSYRSRNIPVILGGIHASVNKDEALKNASSVCVGEADNLWRTILKDCENGDLKQIYFDGQPVDLTKVPAPNRNIIKQSKYLYTNILYTSRGCPYLCEFCYNSCDYVHKQYRNRSIQNVLDEIDSFSTKQVMFIDDNFIGNIRWTREFLKAIKYKGLTWHAAVSSNIVNHEELLDEMQETGCRSLFIGFESINKNSIKSVQKNQNQIDKYEKLIDSLHQRGIMVNASMVFGFDDDGPKVFQHTLDWLVANKVETVTAHILTPYPGTKLFKKLKEQARIVDFDWRQYNTSNVVYKPNQMTAQELSRGYNWLYKEFYSMKNIVKRLPDAPQNRIPYLLFNFGYRKYGNLFAKLGQIGFMNLLGRVARRLSYGIG